MRSNISIGTRLSAAALLAILSAGAQTQPPEPVDLSPIDGETYYLINQRSGMQADLADARAVQQPRSFTSLSQRWAFTSVPGGAWHIVNLANGLCLDGDSPFVRRARGQARARRGVVAMRPCSAAGAQQWTVAAASNGYSTLANQATGLLLDLAGDASRAGAWLMQSASSGAPPQSRQWLLRPAFFRGIDNALLEKQETARVSLSVPWWTDAGQPGDLLAMMKSHGVNMVRLRPSSVPPYANISQPGCSGNACYGETDAQDLDLARRVKNLGMSIELTLLFDGGASASVPPAWSGDTTLAALQTDLYSYVRAEIAAYRQAGVMPDLVSVGNEVDTGFLGTIGSPTGAAFGGFATLQTTAVQAIDDAASDPAFGPAIPPPLTCIHITPAWDLTQFFTLVHQFAVPYDAICQSYYPLYHGPLTAAQAAAANPGGKPVEQQVLENAVQNIGKPIFILETGEHYQNGFSTNDPWYTPPSPTVQRQFLLDLQSVVKGLANNLGMGIAYWDPAGVNIPGAIGIFNWNGLTLFDPSAALLPGMDVIGGKLDPTLAYQFVNRIGGQILAVSASSQWRITGSGDGYFQIAGASDGSVVLGGAGAEWDVVSAGGGYFKLVDRVTGMVLDLSGVPMPDSGAASEQWQIVPVH